MLAKRRAMGAEHAHDLATKSMHSSAEADAGLHHSGGRDAPVHVFRAVAICSGTLV